MKLVTEDSKPVGSGRFREQTRDAEAVPGLVLALLIQHRTTSVSLLCREANSRHPCFSSGNVIFPIRDDSMNSSFWSQTPQKRERITKHEGRANFVDCPLISRFSARRGACHIILKMPI